MDTTTADAEGMISEGEAFATWAPNVKVALEARRARV